jgi:spore maturation protein CgeB
VRVSFRIVFIGLAMTSAWGNGHAATYRGLVRELVRRGHDVLFLERDAPCHNGARDLPEPPFGTTCSYAGLDELRDRFASEVTGADVVIVGSHVPDGVAVGEWVLSTARGVRAFYDIDTPITIGALEQGRPTYIEAPQVSRYDLYLTFTTGPLMQRIASKFRARRVAPLCCSADSVMYYPEPCDASWDLGYLGTYSADRQPALERLLIEPARHWNAGAFVVAGPEYPVGLRWPANVERHDHLSPSEHRAFYNGQRYTLNVTRSAMLEAGYSPNIRLFEAAACGTPIITDHWPGLDEFFAPGHELFVATNARDVLDIVRQTPERERLAVGQRGRERVIREHTAAHRAEALEQYVCEIAPASRAKVARKPVVTLAAQRGQP